MGTLDRERLARHRELGGAAVENHEPAPRASATAYGSELRVVERAGGVVAARDHLFFPEHGLDPHRPVALLLWFPDEPNHWEDVSGGLDRKVAALLCHTSQSATTMGGARDGEGERQAFASRIENRAAEVGETPGLAAAEAFRRITP